MTSPPIDALPTLGVNALRREWARLLRSGRLTPTAIVVGGVPGALLLPYDTAAEIASARQISEIPLFSAGVAADLLLDLLFRAQRLNAPTGITCRKTPAVAIVPLAWADDLATAGPAPAPLASTTTEGKQS